MLSAGSYIIYWFYLTWKQLASEPAQEHHPVWHALALLVPIYSLFRMHRHVTVIKALAVGTDLTASLSPGLTVVLWAVSNALDWSVFRATDAAVIIVLTLIGAALSTTFVVLAQSTLNQFWVSVRTQSCKRPGLGWER